MELYDSIELVNFHISPLLDFNPVTTMNTQKKSLCRALERAYWSEKLLSIYVNGESTDVLNGWIQNDANDNIIDKWTWVNLTAIHYFPFI